MCLHFTHLNTMKTQWRLRKMKTYTETLETYKQRKPLTYVGILKTKKNAYVKTLKTEKLLTYMETLKTEKQRKPL